MYERSAKDTVIFGEIQDETRDNMIPQPLEKSLLCQESEGKGDFGTLSTIKGFSELCETR